MTQLTVKTISQSVPYENSEVDLDQALTVAGVGWYNLKYSFVLALFLIAVIIEPVGYSYVLPAARCDLEMTDQQRGLILSMPYIGIVVTSFPWGYLVDTKGRKKMIIYSSMAAGTLGIISAFMPNLLSFAIVKFLSSLCIACPASVPYSFIGEILPPKQKDLILSITNALQISGAALVPLLAWAILPLDFRIDFGSFYFCSWRLLTIVYASVLLLSAFCMSFGPESPKYLMEQDRHDESLRVLKNIYAGNKNKSPDEYPIKSLKTCNLNKLEKPSFFKSLSNQTMPLLKPSYLKYMILNGTLLFGTFATLNGLYMWLPDVLNKVLSGRDGGLTACQVITKRLNATEVAAECNDKIEEMTFIINIVANSFCTVLAIVVSGTVKLIGKKFLLILVYFSIGVFILLINFVTQEILFAILLSSIPVMGLSIGPVNAFAVEIFPTNLRGMAIGLTMMIGRSGSAIGTNAAGLLLNVACETTFYGFGGSLILCGLLAFLQPKSRKIMNQHKA